MFIKTNVYVDGFSLYYRAVKGTPYKWLDLYKLSCLLVPRHQGNRVRYFTAVVQGRPGDPQARLRQQTYIRALKTLPNLAVHYGQFKTRRKTVRLVAANGGVGDAVEVWDTEEKGSDVNLATYLLADGFAGDYEQALVISNDSDLAEAVRIARNQVLRPVGVVNPNVNPREATPKELSDAATFQRRLTERALQACQFPPTLTDAVGTITKPSSW